MTPRINGFEGGDVLTNQDSTDCVLLARRIVRRIRFGWREILSVVSRRVDANGQLPLEIVDPKDERQQPP